MSYYPQVERWTIPRRALELSREEMASDGRHGDEGIALWLGTKKEGEARITHVTFLRGPAVLKSPANIQVHPELMRAVHEAALDAGVILVGQVHSHSADYGVNLSPSDHAYGFHVPYFLSIVWPNYAQTASTTLADCGVHIFLPEKGYKRLSRLGVARKIALAPRAKVKVLIVGNP
jgi:hypothetical protein